MKNKKKEIPLKLKYARKLYKKMVEDFSDRRGIKHFFDKRHFHTEADSLKEMNDAQIKIIADFLEESFGLP